MHFTESERINYFYCGLRGNNALLFNAQLNENDIKMLNEESIPTSLQPFITRHLDGIPNIKKTLIENEWNTFDKYSTLTLKLSRNNIVDCYGEKTLTFKEQYSNLKNNLDKIVNKCSSTTINLTSYLLSIIFPEKEQADAFLVDSKRRWGLYNNMSAGQRIISGMIAAVCANIKENSILLIDEPETHLHPGLLSSFMAIIEKILEEFSSYAVVATHSPLILQQVPSFAVTIFERRKNNVSWRKPDFECFGESQQMISEMALDLAEPELDFHDKLNKLFEQDNNIESINTLFNNQLGFAARLYLESLKKQIEER